MAYSKEDIDKIFNYVCSEIEKGRALRNVLKDNEMPSTSTFYEWLDNDDVKSKQYANSILNSTYIENTKCKANKKGSKAILLNDYRIENAKKINSLKFPDSNIYILNIENTNLYKIGVSQNINRRLKDISNSMPFNVNLIFSLNVKNTYDLESKLHNMYSEFYIKNEWFELGINEIFNIIKLCQDQ